MPHNLQEPPRSLSTVHLCQRERGIHGGMQGAVFSSMVVHLVLVVVDRHPVSIAANQSFCHNTESGLQGG